MALGRTMSRRESKQQSGANRPRLTSYGERTQWPLQSLYFLLPLLLAYELGTFAYRRLSEAKQLPSNSAEAMLAQLIEIIGGSAYYLPGLLVVVVLIAIHLAKPRRERDPWRPEPRLWAFMWLESMVLALPLFVFGVVLFRGSPETAMNTSTLLASSVNEVSVGSRWSGLVLLSIGAGIYEELLFRLIAIAAFHTLLVNVMGLKPKQGAMGAILLSAIAFGVYHFLPDRLDLLTGMDGYAWKQMIFYTVAGVYFAVVYVSRGFGIVVGTHAVYDVVVVTLPLLFNES